MNDALEMLRQLYNFLVYAGASISYGALLLAYFQFIEPNLPGSSNQTLKDLLKHIYIIGQTGTGKTTFLLNKIHEYKKHGSVVFICYKDQKTADELLDTFSDEEKDRVIYIDPSMPNQKIGFNIFGDARTEIKNELYVNSMIDTYKTIWGDAIGASTEDIFRMLGLGVAEMEIRTPLEIYKCLSKEFDEYRESIVNKTKNIIVKNFLKYEFPDKLKNFGMIAPPRNKQRRIVSSPVLLHTLCQSNPLFNLEKEVNEGKIIIANFNQEKLGAENARFLSSLFFSQLQIIGFTRKDKKTPIFVVADEFQEYINPSFETFLSEARSFNMSLTLAHQYRKQITYEIKSAIDGNVASNYTFRVGREDVDEVTKYLDENMKKKFKDLRDYVCMQEIISNGQKQPAVIKKAPPPPKTYNNREYIIKNSLDKYGIAKKYIERDILKRFEGLDEDIKSSIGGMSI